MVLGKLPVPGRPTNLDYSTARAYCACNRCGWGVVWAFFLSSITSFLSPSLWETTRYRLKYCLKGPLNPEQTNQPKLYYSLHGKRIFIQLHCMKFHTLDMHIHLLEPKPALTLFAIV